LFLCFQGINGQSEFGVHDSCLLKWLLDKWN
jgi:hypothetical protein